MRLFVGIPVPKEIGERLEKVGRELERYGKERVKKVKKENMHITLLFLGEGGKEEVEKFSHIEPFPPFTVRVEGLGAFPSPSYARVVWAGARGEVEGLAEKVWEVYWKEERFHPHVTIARLKHPRGVEEVIREHARELWGEFEVRELILYQSTLKRSGPVYTPLRVVRSLEK